ncbi:MAG TPA: hypothetical protein VKE91_11900 [Blastocatellia bacterium]|nr:hypothetical protein [Blastocatellia bacterium]
MEPNIQDQPQQFKPTGAATSTARAASDGGQTVTDKVSNAAYAVREQAEDRAAEIINQAKQKVSEVYDQTNKRMIEQYEKAIDYGRENPGKTTLIAFGVGVGVGVLLVSGFSGSRSRRSHVVEPVMRAVSTLACELFR